MFKDQSDQRPNPPRFLTVQADESGHPRLRWQRNSEDDISRYRIYRAPTEGGPPAADDLVEIGEVNHPTREFTDLDVLMNYYLVNYYIWYAVRAVDLGDHESVNSKVERFWGYYTGQGQGEEQTTHSILNPESFGLRINPNPFNPTTAISYQLSANRFVSLKIYDSAGRLVTELVNGWREAGSHEVTFDGTNLATGIYLYSLTAGQDHASGKIVLLK